MKCKKCDTQLSLQDLEKNEWVDDSEIFYLKCPVCDDVFALTSNLFDEQGHISQQYLGLIVSDSEKQKKEKFIDYIPELQKKKLFQHLEICQECKLKIENIRLTEISKEIEFNEKTYSAFFAKAKDVIKQLDKDKINFKDNQIYSFVYENERYKVSQDDLIYERKETLNGIEIQRLCYDVEKDDFYVGMASFVISNDRIILEKIWLKSEERIEKEKEFLKNVRNGKFRILFSIIKNLNKSIF